MVSTTARALLLASASAATLWAFNAHAQSIIPGGGGASAAVDLAGPAISTSPTPTSPSEFNTWNTVTGGSTAQFSYNVASSGRGQAAFSGDNPSALNPTTSPLPASIAFAATDAFLTPSATTSVVNGFTYTTVSGISGTTADYPLRATQDGALIEIPVLGVGVTIPAASGNAKVKTNGTLHLTDSDLCGIFSGLITDYGSIANPLAGLSGPITTYYRSDSAGATFMFTNHLKAVCTASDGGGTPNSNFTTAQLALMPTTGFSGLFGGSNPTLPATFKGASGVAALAESLAGTVTTSGGGTVNNPGDPTGIGYLTADYTDISPSGAANATDATGTAVNGTTYTGFINTKALYTAGLQGKTSSGKTSFLTPTTANILTGLQHPGAGSTNPNPPVKTKKADPTTNPLNWVPSVPVVTSGYPIVGYTSLILAQCYADPNVAAGLVSFLTLHYQDKAAYASTLAYNGFTIPAKTYTAAIIKDFLTASAPLAIAAASTAGTCATVTGR